MLIYAFFLSNCQKVSLATWLVSPVEGFLMQWSQNGRRDQGNKRKVWKSGTGFWSLGNFVEWERGGCSFQLGECVVVTPESHQPLWEHLFHQPINFPGEKKLGLGKVKSETMRAICESVDELLKIAQKFSRLQQGVKVILLKQIPRFDCKKRMAWGDRMNTIIEEKEKQCSQAKLMFLSLRMKYQRQKDKLIGEVGQNEFGIVDLLHLRGAKGRQLYTESMVPLVNSLKGGRAESKVNLPRLKEHLLVSGSLATLVLKGRVSQFFFIIS